MYTYIHYAALEWDLKERERYTYTRSTYWDLKMFSLLVAAACYARKHKLRQAAKLCREALSLESTARFVVFIFGSRGIQFTNVLFIRRLSTGQIDFSLYFLCKNNTAPASPSPAHRHVHVCTRRYTHMHTHIHARIHTHTYTHTQTHADTRKRT